MRSVICEKDVVLANVLGTTIVYAEWRHPFRRHYFKSNSSAIDRCSKIRDGQVGFMLLRILFLVSGNDDAENVFCQPPDEHYVSMMQVNFKLVAQQLRTLKLQIA